MMVKSQIEAAVNSLYDRYHLSHQNKTHPDQTIIQKIKTIQVYIDFISFFILFFFIFRILFYIKLILFKEQKNNYGVLVLMRIHLFFLF
jgi:hypothetical protein